MQLLHVENCPKHVCNPNLDMDDICGCPATDRRKGFLIYKDPTNAHNWVVWDCTRWKWVTLAGDWATAFKSYEARIRDIPLDPVRCSTMCSQYPCKHDWRLWHLADIPPTDLTQQTAPTQDE